MSWRCNYNNSRDEVKPWVHVHVAFIDGGIPINFICHADCLRKGICEKNGDVIEGMENLNDTFLENIKDAERNIKILDAADDDDENHDVDENRGTVKESQSQPVNNTEDNNRYNNYGVTCECCKKALKNTDILLKEGTNIISKYDCSQCGFKKDFNCSNNPTKYINVKD